MLPGQEAVLHSRPADHATISLTATMHLRSRRRRFGGPFVVMAIAANRISVILTTSVAVGAIHLRVGLIQIEAGHRMLEVLLVPPGVTIDAHTAQL